MCGLNVGPTWDSCAFFLFFKWAFDGPELGTNWALWGLLCRSHMGCPHVTRLLLATYVSQRPRLGKPICGLSVGTIWDSYVFFHVAFPGVTADGCMRMQKLLRASGTNHDLLSLKHYRYDTGSKN